MRQPWRHIHFKAQKQTPKIHQVPVEWLICTTCCGHRWRTSCKSFSMYTERQSISAQKPRHKCNWQLWSTWNLDQKSIAWTLKMQLPYFKTYQLQKYHGHFPNGISRTYSEGLVEKNMTSPVGSLAHEIWNLLRHNLDHFLTHVKVNTKLNIYIYA